MAKSRDKRGREEKKKKKPKKLAVPALGTDVAFRHHTVTTTAEPPKPPE
jgi:hypothetical protein